MIEKTTGGSLLAAFLLFAAPFTPAQVRAGQAHILSGPLVVSDRWPECTNLQTWTRDVMRLEKMEDAGETAQAKVFFRWLRLFSKMATGGMIQAHEGPYGKEQYVLDAHKNLFVYGWGYCDTHSRIAEAAWSEFKQDRSAVERVVVQHHDGGYHTMYRLRLDGRFGAFDARYGYYLIDRDAPDARILDWAEVGVDENILRNRGYRCRSQPFFEYFGREWERALLVEPTYYASEEAWEKAGRPPECVFGNGQYVMGTPLHDMGFQLPKGTTLERFWDNSARKFYVPAGFENKGEEPFRPSGRFYRITESMLDGNWVKFDPNYAWSRAYVTTVPADEGYNADVSGGRTIGQAWGRMTYEPDWQSRDFLSVSAVTTDLVHYTTAPYLRPKAGTAGGSAVFDFYSPYILVDGLLVGKWSGSERDGFKVEIRALLPKPRSGADPDVWTPWQSLHTGPGSFRVALGRERFNPRDVSIHGVYRFQLRFSVQANSQLKAPAGLKQLRLETYFENGLMSIPRIGAGTNTIHFKVADASTVRGPIQVVYRYQTSSGERSHHQLLQPKDFHHNVVTYRLDAPGLLRCNSLLIRY